MKLGILNILPQAYAIIGDDATKHMYHYLGNSGSPFQIDLEDMLDDVPSARERFEAEAAQAQAFVELLDLGAHDITSRMMQGGYNEKDENWDKGKAVTIFDITVTDEFMGEFHRQGIAREFDCTGSIRRSFSWRKGQPLTKEQLTTPVGGRA